MTARFGSVGADRVEAEKTKLSRLCTFLRRYVRTTIEQGSDSRFALALFTKDSILIELFVKNGPLTKELAASGIAEATVWRETGFNAVTRGMLTSSSAATVGEQNEMTPLQKYAIYYAPISMLSIYEPYDPAEECGLAIIAPLRNAWYEYLTMVRGVAHDMMINLQFNNIATMYYERSGKGLLSIDNMMEGDRRYIATYYNAELFAILGVKPVEMHYQPADKLIDPLPANRELWEIVDRHRTLTDHPLAITCQGKTVNCIVSTDVYNQPAINAHGVILYITNQRKINEDLSSRVANGAIKTFDNIIGEDPRLRRLIERARRLALTGSNIMILGESGTGKDLFAQAIHNSSSRSGKPFIALNCGAIPRDLIESELFGYDTGAFTGAKRNGNIGKFELAMGGTIFLDEIGEMPLELQAKLLRVVEQKQIMRLGGNKLIDVDVRILSATNANVWQMVDRKLFRSDLFYRLSTMTLELMPLRERKADIILLSEHFIRQITARIHKSNVMRLTPEAKELLVSLPWEGNIRELQNLIECLVQLYPGDEILPEYIRENVLRFSGHRALPASRAEASRAGAGRVGAVTREQLVSALAECGNNRTEAARALGISRRTLYRRLEEYGLD